jgi:hypothetical protein
MPMRCARWLTGWLKPAFPLQQCETDTPPFSDRYARGLAWRWTVRCT